jgi:hypothetical protein
MPGMNFGACLQLNTVPIVSLLTEFNSGGYN